MKRQGITYITIAIYILVGIVSCEKNQQEYISKNTRGILSLNLSSNIVEADGVSFITVSAYLTQGADKLTVGFKTTSGLFQDSNSNSVNITALTKGNDSIVATTWLISSLKVTPVVRLTASVPSLDTTAIISFINALPDSLHIESSVGSISKGFNSQAPLLIKLIRITGTPSLGQNVNFSALTELGIPIGQFNNIPASGSDSNGQITSTFLLKDTLYLGKIRVFASCAGKNNSTLIDSTFFYVTK